MNKSKFKKITSARLFLPVVCLIAVLLINVIKTPDFFNITIRNGVFYGYVIDVINRASELVILAVGMTLVTAASGGRCCYGSCSGCMLSDFIRWCIFSDSISEFSDPCRDRSTSCGSTLWGV